ncbi:hypothetical protein PIB30_065332 [Stylosanthes scabra]|uniref:Uncharacterized protein n=1 Tax=Stylosanthes scabra TaxID=79078 RepID=A0ABU6QMP8_9FABA|nr:hypothetical protein [Stylosanthes scabra]
MKMEAVFLSRALGDWFKQVFGSLRRVVKFFMKLSARWEKLSMLLGGRELNQVKASFFRVMVKVLHYIVQRTLDGVSSLKIEVRRCAFGRSSSLALPRAMTKKYIDMCENGLIIPELRLWGSKSNMGM